jgi:hypothetical protein
MACYGDSFTFTSNIIINIIIIVLQMGCPPGGSVNTIQITYTTK